MIAPFFFEDPLPSFSAGGVRADGSPAHCFENHGGVACSIFSSLASLTPFSLCLSSFLKSFPDLVIRREQAPLIRLEENFLEAALCNSFTRPSSFAALSKRRSPD